MSDNSFDLEKAVKNLHDLQKVGQELFGAGGAEREAREWLENYCDKRLGKGQRPCGWPNFGSIRVDEVVVMLAAYANEARLEALEQAAQAVERDRDAWKPSDVREPIWSWLDMAANHNSIAAAIRALKAAQHGEKELRKGK